MAVRGRMVATFVPFLSPKHLEDQPVAMVDTPLPIGIVREGHDQLEYRILQDLERRLGTARFCGATTRDSDAFAVTVQRTARDHAAVFAREGVKVLVYRDDHHGGGMGESGRGYHAVPVSSQLITHDVEALLQSWASVSGFRLPSGRYFQLLRAELVRQLGNASDYGLFSLSYADLYRRLRRLASTMQQPRTVAVSLDAHLVDYTPWCIEMTRLRHHRTLKKIGEGSRPGQPCIKEQVARVVAGLPSAHGVHIVTDGCWTSSEVLLLQDLFRRHDIPVVQVTTGILVHDGEQELARAGIPVAEVFRFRSLYRWICERDYFPGVPRSGLNIGSVVNGHLTSHPEDVGVPYILPFPQDIHDDLPHAQREQFSVWCLRAAQDMFTQIERHSGRLVLLSDLHRLPFGMTRSQERYPDALERLISQSFRNVPMASEIL